MRLTLKMLSLDNEAQSGSVSAPPVITDISLANNDLASGSAQGTLIGKLSATGGTAPFTFSLVDDASGKVQIDGDFIEVGATASDYDSADTFNITVGVLDSLGETFEKEFAVDVAAVGDLYWGNVVLLMGFEGADGATGAPGMTDESIVGRGNATVQGNAQIDTGIALVGASSLLLDGTGDYIQFADSVDWQLASSNAMPYCIEITIRWHTLGLNKGLLSQTDGISAFAWQLLSGGTDSDELSFTSSSNLVAADVTVVSSGADMQTGVTYKICLEKDELGVHRLMVDGVVKGSTTLLTTIGNAVSVLRIGARGVGADPAHASIDEVRITKNAKRYGGAYTPVSEFPRFPAITDITFSQAPVYFGGAVHGDALFELAGVRVGTPSFSYYLIDDADGRLQINGAVIEAGPNSVGDDTTFRGVVMVEDDFGQVFVKEFTVFVADAAGVSRMANDSMLSSIGTRQSMLPSGGFING